jgi:hypothetical protein
MNLLQELRTRQELYVNKREELYLKDYSFEDALCIEQINDALFILSNEIDFLIAEAPPFFNDRLDSLENFKRFDNQYSWLLN